MENFTAELIKTVTKIRKEYADANIGDMSFSIDVSGRSLTGDLKIEFKFSQHGYGNIVTSGHLEAGLEEFLRQHGWQKRHAALCLPAAGEPTVANDSNETPY